MPLSKGARLGPYEIEAAIGAGGMGEVYRARDTRLDRTVAIKVLPAGVAADPDRRRRFEQEARAASALNHPHICVLYDVGSQEGTDYLVMEYLVGETLTTRLAKGPLPVDETLEVGVQVADALAVAHKQGVIHRDLKPGNVMLTKAGAKLLDFGLAKRAAAPYAASEAPTAAGEWITGAGVALGSVGYMSPEQVRGEPIDARTDLFSFGVVLYEMATGTTPFRGATSGAVLSELLASAPVAPARLNPQVPPELERIINKLLEKDRDTRYKSAADVRVDLERLRRTLSGASASDGDPASIVVLPFENLSPDPENAFFADGLTEEIITDLSKIGALRVISRTSAMHYKGTTKPLPAIARELNVRHVLEGSVRRAGNSLRITAQLIDATTDTHLWAEKYTGVLDDVFEIQEKLSRTIVDALEVRLTPEEDRSLAARQLPDARAFERYLKAQQEMYKFTPASLSRALELTREAIASVGPNALLYAMLGHIHFQFHDIFARTDDATLTEALTWSDRALELSPDCGLAFLVKGALARKRGEMGAAIRLTRRAADLGGGGEALLWLSYLCFEAGRADECRHAAARAMTGDPLVFGPSAGAYAALADGDLPLSLLQMRAAARAIGEVSFADVFLAFLHLYVGQDDEAERTLSRIARSGAGIWVDLGVVFGALFRGDREAAEGAMARSPVFPAARADRELSWWLADSYARLGDRDRALDWLGAAIDFGFCNDRFWSAIDPMLVPLRGDPHFESLMGRAREKRRAFEM